MKNVKINKGNYSLDTKEREEEFTKKRAFGVEADYYQNRKEWDEFAKQQYVAQYPLLVDLELSSVCNLHCPFCYTISDEFKKKVNTKLMDFELFKKVIDEIGDKVFAIRLSLRGEPTLHPHFLDCIKYAKEKRIKEVSTLTNGSRMTLDLYKKCVEAGLDWITWSFDGLYEEYEKNRNPLKFDVSYGNLSDIQKYREENDIKKPVIKIQTVWPAIQKNPTEYYEKMSKVSDLVAFNPLIDFTHPTPFEEIQFEENFCCPQVYQRLVIGADGLAMMCANDEENLNVVGDANKETIYEIWHGEKLTKVRQTINEKDGFKKIEACRLCFLPRCTREDHATVCGRDLIVRNYV